ncbi:MAG TPA: DUF4386 domain-containing protein [Ornithinibacter sp.]|nr:DUF4386 domain-containing protein [Ornithinibacter sp.]
MSTTTAPSATTGPTGGDTTTAAPRTDRTRGNSRAAGIFYLLTFAASIPALLLLDPVLNDPGYVLGAGHDTQVLFACLLDVVTALTGIGSAVAVFPVVRRVNESLALGFVMSRMVEAAVILIGVVAVLTVVGLRQDLAGTASADAAALTTTGQALVTARDWTFLLGPGFMACINALLFGTLLYRSRLVPRLIPTIGLVGAPVLLTANLLTFFGQTTQTGSLTLAATLPIAAWELSVGFYLAFKGFRPAAVAGLAA